MKCNSCISGIISSKCVEYDENNSVQDKIESFEKQIEELTKKFENSIDGKTLGTGTDLIKTVQKLVDKQIEIKQEKDLIIDLSGLGIASNKISQEKLNLILVEQLSKLNQMENKTHNY